MRSKVIYFVIFYPILMLYFNLPRVKIFLSKNYLELNQFFKQNAANQNICTKLNVILSATKFVVRNVSSLNFQQIFMKMITSSLFITTLRLFICSLIFRNIFFNVNPKLFAKICLCQISRVLILTPSLTSHYGVRK